MSSVPPDPIEPYRVRPVEPDRQEKTPYKESERENRSGLLAFFLLLVHKLLGFFQKPEELSFRTAELAVPLEQLRNAFQLLKTEDRSQDSAFLEELSFAWHHTLDEATHYHPNKRGSISQLIQEFDTYPDAEEFTFGYYLKEYAGEKWLPFPYMDLIQKLHLEHQRDPNHSALTRWTSLIDHILEGL